jgi:aminodeoxyfutalosine deaminase
MPHFTAPLVFHDGRFHTGLSVHVREDGFIVAIEEANAKAEMLDGILCPGFVNAHCHLELSHLRGHIPEKTGMAEFAKAVVSQRNIFSEAEIIQHAKAAATEMHSLGIAAVGDISNQPVTAELKKEFQPEGLHFHTFVELLGARPEMCESIMATGKSILAAFGIRQASLSPHATYSISAALLEAIVAHSKNAHVSIHCLESAQERQLFASKDGPMMELLNEFGVPFGGAEFTSPLSFVLPELKKHQGSRLFVHNTEITADEIQQIMDEVLRPWFVLCPLSNLYIHSTLPDAALFHRMASFRVCLGTDSLASNHVLDMVAEMRTLQSAFPELSSETLLNWATVNGAYALGLSESHGSLNPGTKPGLTFIAGVNAESGNFTPASASRRLI